MNLPVPVPVATIVLLILSNVFMTFAWYGHLRYKALPLLAAIVISWGIAFFEYLLQVPANRVGYGYFSAAELKAIQEIISLSVFAFFSTLEPPRRVQPDCSRGLLYFQKMVAPFFRKK